MKVEKKVICSLNKCYSIAPLWYRGKNCFLVAAEGHDPCYLFSETGERLDTIWTEPGGVMTMRQLPGSDGVFLATHRFYSPDDAADAEIVVAQPDGAAGWKVRTLCKAPFVHRFGIIERGGVCHLLVCCLKSGQEHKGDWSRPGAVWSAVLPADLSGFDAAHPLPLQCVKDGMLKNHGYSEYRDGEVTTAIVGCDSGVWQFVPPERAEAPWTVRRLTDRPSSDAVLLDFDGDGKPELGSISPFHGDTLEFFRQDAAGDYRLDWTSPKRFGLLHATWPCLLGGRPAWVVGCREGERESMLVTWDDGTYRLEPFDRAGAANALLLENGLLVMTNREIDEVAMYAFR